MKGSLMNQLLKTAAMGFLLFTVACNDNAGDNANAADSTEDHAMTETGTSMSDTASSATAELSGTKPDTTVSGTVRFAKDGDKVKMTLDISVPKKANSSVAVHIHAMGDCGDMGKHAGGHWNPTNKEHGKWGSDNFHSGDIGNIDLDGQGNGKLEITTDLWSIGGDSTKNVVGKTIIVHSGKDDYKSQPAGASGERIGCGVIK